MSNKKHDVYFSYDDLNILGAFKSKVFIKGYYYEEKGDMKDCVLSMSKSLLHTTLNYWIIGKKRYCERFGHFCGVMGSLQSKNYKVDKKTINILDCSDDKDILRLVEPVYKDVQLFNIISFKKETDMEHG